MGQSPPGRAAVGDRRHASPPDESIHRRPAAGRGRPHGPGDRPRRPVRLAVPLLAVLALHGLAACGPDPAARSLAGSGDVRGPAAGPAAPAARPAPPADDREAAIADQLARDAEFLARGLDARSDSASGSETSASSTWPDASDPAGDGTLAAAATPSPDSSRDAARPAASRTGRPSAAPPPPAWNQSSPGAGDAEPGGRSGRTDAASGRAAARASGPRQPDPAILGLLDPPSLEPWSGGREARDRDPDLDRPSSSRDRGSTVADAARRHAGDGRDRLDSRAASASRTRSAPSVADGEAGALSPWVRDPFGTGRPEATAAEGPRAAGPLASTEAELEDGGDADLPPNPVAVSRSDYRLAMLVDAIDHPERALSNAVASALTLVGDPDATLDASILRGVPESDRDLVEACADFARAFGGPIEGAADPVAGPVDREALLEAIDELRARVARTPTLTIGRAALCTAVEGFGLFTALPTPHRFLAGRTNETILYVEVDDFHSEQRAGGAAGRRAAGSAAPRPSDPWVTQLEQRILIYNDRDARPVWDSGWEEVVDVNANRRRDFFTGQVLRLPPSFSLGTYLLKVQVRDELTGAEAEVTIEFEMVAGGAGLAVD